MRVWVIGRGDVHASAESAANVLGDLGCMVVQLDLWDAMGEIDDALPAPHAIVIEALDQVDAARAALERLRESARLVAAPILVCVTVAALQRLRVEDGFDDFVLAPYVPAELYVRLRRVEWQRSDFRDNERIKMGPLSIDLAAHEVSAEGRSLKLTHQEFELLRFFAQNRGRVFERDALLRRVWGVEHYGGSRTVDIHVRRLRAKLGAVGEWIETVRGVGYKFRESP
jgi:DNA-binding response OmpR family regulator